jgi:hypothetical protein
MLTRLLWPLLLIGLGIVVLFQAADLSERFDAWTIRLRAGNAQLSPPVGKTRTLRTRIVTTVLRFAAIYVVLAGVVGLVGFLVTR